MQAELVRIAVELERSMLLKIGVDDSRIQHSPDLQVLHEFLLHSQGP